MKKLVFVEGVSGVGKSTTAVKLCNVLNDLGFRAVCHSEGDADNPVDFFNCAYLTKAEFSQLLQDYPSYRYTLINNSVQEADYVLVRYGDRNTAYFASPLLDVLKSHEGFYKPVKPIAIEQYTEVFTDCWRRFLHQDQGNENFVIFDGSFLFHRANDLIQNYNATNVMIAAHLKALLSAMIPYNPLLFYLSSKDVGARLIQARESRGQATTSEAQIAFEVERKIRQIQVLNLLPIQACIVDISNGWKNTIDDMMKYITEDAQ
ncbi:MAG: hypothetical protein ABFD25_13880 [Clostridiaceae bacterium]